MLRLPDKFTLCKRTFKPALVAFDNMGADDSRFNAFACPGISFALMGASSVGTNLFSTLRVPSFVVYAGIRNIGANYCIISSYTYFADASFEASAFYKGGTFPFYSFLPRLLSRIQPVLFDKTFFGEIDRYNGSLLWDGANSTILRSVQAPYV